MSKRTSYLYIRDDDDDDDIVDFSIPSMIPRATPPVQTLYIGTTKNPHRRRTARAFALPFLLCRSPPFNPFPRNSRGGLAWKVDQPVGRRLLHPRATRSIRDSSLSLTLSLFLFLFPCSLCFLLSLPRFSSFLSLFLSVCLSVCPRLFLFLCSPFFLFPFVFLVRPYPFFAAFLFPLFFFFSSSLLSLFSRFSSLATFLLSSILSLFLYFFSISFFLFLAFLFSLCFYILFFILFLFSFVLFLLSLLLTFFFLSFFLSFFFLSHFLFLSFFFFSLSFFLSHPSLYFIFLFLRPLLLLSLFLSLRFSSFPFSFLKFLSFFKFHSLSCNCCFYIALWFICDAAERFHSQWQHQPATNRSALDWLFVSKWSFCCYAGFS